MKSEEDIIQESIQKFAELTGSRIRTIRILGNEKDAEVEIEINGIPFRFTVEVKSEINKGELALLRDRIYADTQDYLIVTDSMNSAAAETARELSMNYIDAQGNAYIKLPSTYIDIRGKNNKNLRAKQPRNRAYKTAGMRVVYALLCNPGLENSTYDEIAEASGVSAGSAHIVLKDLHREGFLFFKSKSNRKLIEKQRLFEKWIILYPEQLKRKFYLGSYQTDNADFWKNIDIKKTNCLWGGETAAALLTNYLKPAFHTVYAKANIGKFLAYGKLTKAENGNAEVIKQFWNFRNEDKRLVHPLLIYTDLMNSGNSRCIDTAKLIYERELAEYLREN